jgi:diguanylate cyclase (GGDEF)-like protein
MYSNKRLAVEIDLEKGTLVLFQNELWDKTKYFEPMHEYNYGDILYLFVNRYVDESDRERISEALSLGEIKKHFEENGSTLSIDFLMNMSDVRVPVLFHLTLLSPVAGKCRGIIEPDDGEEDEAEETSYNAGRDPLTHLLNRSAFDKAMRDALSRPGTAGAFYMLDIDDFKSINDKYGHTMGDVMLKKTADWMSSILPGNAIIGRFGGDEFVAYLPMTEEDIEKTSKRYGEKIILSSKMVEEVPNFSCSIGISLFPQHARTHQELFDRADQTLYFVKENGKGGCEIYNSSIPSIGSAVKHKKKDGLFGKIKFELFTGFLGVIAAASFIFLIFSYFDTLSELTEDEGAEYLLNLSDSTLEEMNSKLSDCREQLNTVEKSISFIGEHADYKNMLAFLESFENALGCTCIAMLDDSMAWHAPYNTRNLPQIAEFAENNPEAEFGYIKLDGIKRQNCFAVFHYPENMVFEQHQIKLIAALYYGDDIANMFFGRESPENASAAVCSSDGTIEYKENSFFMEGNVFDFLKNVRIKEYNTLDKLRLDFINSEQGFLNFVYDGVKYEAYYSDLLGNGNVFFFCVKLDEINKYANKFLVITLGAFCAVTAVVVLTLVGVSRSRRSKWRRIKNIAYVDKLSGMATVDKLQEEYNSRLKKDRTPISIICIKIINMSYLNSYFGNHIADMLVKYVGRMINWSLGDEEMLAAVPGAKFYALVRRTEGEPAYRRISEWLGNLVDGVHVMNRVCPVELRAGIYNCESSSEALSDMLGKAEYALNVALKPGTNRQVVSFDGALEKSRYIKKQLSERIDGLIEYGHFKLMLVPYYSLRDGSLFGYASSLHCLFEGEKINFPGDYFQPDYRTDIFSELALYALERVCGDLTYLKDNGLKIYKVRCAFSPAVIDMDSYINRAVAIVSKSNAPKEFINVEVKAEEAHRYYDRLERIVPFLRENGVDFLISCYTGREAHMSELASLKPRCIKLDASFFEDSKISDDMKRRIETIVSQASEFGIEVAADGVNHKTQADFLAKCGCSYAGGNCFSKAIPVEAVFENARSRQP